MAFRWHKSLLLALALLAFGGLRLRFEADLHQSLRQAGVFPPHLELGTREKIGQTSSAVALGGLRTLVATFLNLRTVGFFENRQWADLAETLETVVSLAPRTSFYWENGSWHMAYNAAASYLHDSSMPALRRKEAWRSYVRRGREFLERGTRNNPDDWRLWSNLGFLLTDANKLGAFDDPNECFSAAEQAYAKAVNTGKALPYLKRSRLYAMARIHGREAEALQLARTLFAEGPHNRTPTLLVLLLVLEAHANPDFNVSKHAVEWCNSPAEALKLLANHWRRTRERYPVDGISLAIRQLETQLNIPPDQSVLGRPVPAPPQVDDWFQDDP